MRFDKSTVKASPYLGVFALVTDKVALVPQSLHPKELAPFKEIFNVEIIKCSVGESSLIGVLASAVADKILLSELVTEAELAHLQSIGLKTKIISGSTALGNLLRVTEKGGIISKAFSQHEVKEIESFFGVKLLQASIAESELVGSNCCASNKGFIVNPMVSVQEFSKLEKIFHVKGKPTTANYGDRFVGNCVLANSFGVLVGLNTTGFELMRIDEGLRGDD